MYTGLTGSLKLRDAFGMPRTIAYISGWSVEDKTEMIDCSEFGSSNTNKIAGRKSWSASADGIVTFVEGASQEMLFERKATGRAIEAEFYLDVGEADTDPSKTGTYLKGRGYIESISVDLSASDKGNISISIAGDGALDMIVVGTSILGIDEDEYRMEFHVNNLDGHLYATVPDRYKDDVYVDDNGHLIVKVI